MRVNECFFPALPVNGGCPQGSSLGVLFFNISTDHIEISPEALLEDTSDDEIRVGSLFDTEDRDFLRQNESGLTFSTDNSGSELLPSVVLPPEGGLSDDFSVFLETIPPVSLGEAPFVTLTPSRPCNVGDPFVFASPGLSLIHI